MKILEAKIIRSFGYLIYIVGNNLEKSLASALIKYLEKVYNTKLMNDTKYVLLESDYDVDKINRYMRSYQYMIINGDDISDYKLTYDIYALIKESFNELINIKVPSSENGSILKSKETIKRMLNNNYVILNYINGLINQVGVFGKIDTEIANQFFLKNSLWNHEDSLLCLGYNLTHKNDYQNSLYWYLIGKKLSLDYEMYDEIIVKLEDKLQNYKIEEINKKVEENIKIHKLLMDERAEKNYNIDKYNPTIAKILYQGKFSFFEKQRLMFSQKNIDFSAISLLVNDSNKKNIDETIKYDFRKEEQKKLIDVFNEIIESDNSRPLIITSDNKSLIDIYSQFIGSYFKDYVIINLDVSRFDLRLLDNTYAINNFLYQNIVNYQTDNIVICYHNLQGLESTYLSLFINLLSEEKGYLLKDLEMSINKKNIVNVIFSQDINELDKKILRLSNVFMLDDTNEDEKKEIIKTKFLLELEQKGLDYKNDYDILIEKISEKVNYNQITEVITKITSKLSLHKDEEVLNLIDLFVKTKSIGFK